MTYDSAEDTYEHIRQVSERLKSVCTELRERGRFHDLSKLGPEEKPIFDAVTPRLKGLTYGTDEYRASLKELGPALTHHYAENTHHPEHYPNGIAGMDLLDLIEMYCDWAAATLRTKDGDMAKGIEINIERFAIEGPLAEILRNTWARHGGFCGYQDFRLDSMQAPDDQGGWTREIDGGTGQGFWRKPKPNTAYEVNPASNPSATTHPNTPK
jgi:hypothetical protein